MPERFLVGDKYIASDNVKKVINPFSNEVAGEVYTAGSMHFQLSSEYMTAAFERYKSIPAYKRREILSGISRKISQKKEHLAKLITSETGKPIRFSRLELDRAELTFTLGAEESSRITGEVLSLDLLKGSENKTGIVRRFPIGLILGITPWNFPFNLVAHKVSPALASCNVIIIKPSSNSMMCGIEAAKIILEACSEAGLDFTPVNVLTMPGSEIDKHISDKRIKMISFTGSSDIGWALKGKAGKQRVSLELGGNAGVIVDEGVDIENAAAKIITGGFAAAGQSCISVQRVYVHGKIYDGLRSTIVEQTKKVKFGDPFDEDTVVGPMITESEAVRAEKWVNEARAAGAEILCGGKRHGAVLEPTIIAGASNDLNVKCAEVFAPIITIDRFSKFEEAVDEVNNSRFGLQCGIFTNNLKNVMYAFNNIEAGGVVINDVSAYRMDSMPYGGIKDSGNAREGVAYAIREMTDEKILVLS